MKRILALLLAAVMTAALATGCASKPADSAPAGDAAAPSGAAATGDVIKIGVFEPLTGENGGGGLQEAMGMRYANQVYPTVTVGGKTYKVELVEADNKSDKTEAVTAANYLVSQGVTAVLGSYGSGVSIAAGEIFANAKVAAIGASCTNPQVTEGNDWYFRVCFLDPFQGTVMANYAYNTMQVKKVAVVTQLGDDYSAGLGSFFKKSFEALGGTIVADLQFQTNESDFNAILANVKAAAPDLIFAPSSITTAPLLIKQARAMGITATIAAGDTWENSTIIDNAGKDAEGVLVSTFFDEADPATDEAKSFVANYKKYLADNKQPEIIPAVAALGYDSYLTAIKAIESAGSIDSTAVRDALKALTVVGVTGTFAFDENGDASKDMAVVKVVENGAFKFIDSVFVTDVK